jgi:hypothetical protein
MKKYVDLKLEYQTQENDRDLLLKELILKKKRIAMLHSQLEQYEKLVQALSRDNVELSRGGAGAEGGEGAFDQDEGESKHDIFSELGDKVEPSLTQQIADKPPSAKHSAKFEKLKQE